MDNGQNARGVKTHQILEVRCYFLFKCPNHCGIAINSLHYPSAKIQAGNHANRHANTQMDSIHSLADRLTANEQSIEKEFTMSANG